MRLESAQDQSCGSTHKQGVVNSGNVKRLAMMRGHTSIEPQFVRLGPDLLISIQHQHFHDIGFLSLHKESCMVVYDTNHINADTS